VGKMSLSLTLIFFFKKKITEKVKKKGKTSLSVAEWRAAIRILKILIISFLLLKLKIFE
jgi:hypothetical protein